MFDLFGGVVGGVVAALVGFLCGRWSRRWELDRLAGELAEWVCDEFRAGLFHELGADEPAPKPCSVSLYCLRDDGHPGACGDYRQDDGAA